MHRWEDDIRTDLRKIVHIGVDWIHLSQDRARGSIKREGGNFLIS